MRNIFVTGATGKTGQALIRTLLGPAAGSDGGWHISALTRNASSPAAKRLTESYPSNLTVVEGNLDDRESIIKIFENAKNEGRIWGVFCVLAYPGSKVHFYTNSLLLGASVRSSGVFRDCHGSFVLELWGLSSSALELPLVI